MAGRKYLFRLCRRAVLGALVAFCLIGAGVWTLRQAAAERTQTTNGASTSSAALSSINAVNAVPNSAALAALAGRKFAVSDGVRGAVVGEYEGYFDGATRTLTVRPKAGTAKTSKDSRLDARHDPSGDVPQGPAGFGFSVLRSAFVNTGTTPAVVSGEIELTNNTGVTLYNTRIVFTTFKVGNSSGPDAGNLPTVANGFAYFNDGQVAYNGRLAVSRFYGDIPAGGKVAQIWNFAVPNQPPSFFFAYRVLADVGVATESVAPAAVPVNASTGTSVTINGRGFTGTPTVELLGGASPVALINVTATATAITGTVPAGTAPGIYSVRVVNPGGTADGAGSSTLVRRLTVTGVPDQEHTLTGNIPALPDSGPFLFSGAVTISNSVPIPAGTVIYMGSGATVTLLSSGNLSANGGIPGVTTTNAAQIVFTAQRSPGGPLPGVGVWGGINATAAAASTMMMRNVVVEYGGATGGAAISLTGSGRTLRFTDGIVRGSAGSAITAGGAGDSLVGFARNRIENNGTSAGNPALLVSGNASLGLWDIDSANAATSVGDASYYYTSANEFTGNQGNFVQIGTDAEADTNDFTKSGVLVGQAPAPIRIRGTCANPAVVGIAPPAQPAELVIGPTAIIQLAPDLIFQAGDYPSNRVGCIAADGYGGFYQGPQPATSNKFIEFDKIPNLGNFSAIYFSQLAMNNCVLNYVRIQNGGASSCPVGTFAPSAPEQTGSSSAAVIVEGVNVRITNSQITGSASGGLLQLGGAVVDTRGSTFTGNAINIIETIVGGLLGEGNLASRATLIAPALISVDPQGRGIYVADVTSSANLLRFINTTRRTIFIGGQRIPAGTISTIVGGGLGVEDNIPGRSTDAGNITGLAVSNDGELVYWIDALSQLIRVFNASNTPKTVVGGNLAPGNVTTLVGSGLGSTVNGLAVHPTTGEIYLADATAGVQKVFKVAATGGALTTVAGNSATTRATEAFSPGAATNIPLLQPRALTFDPQGNLYIADTGHGRVIRVDGGGSASLLRQYTAGGGSEIIIIPPHNSPPYPSGLAFTGGKLYVALGNSQEIQVLEGGNATTIAGINGATCDYTSSSCGDAGPISGASFTLTGSTGTPPLVGIAADSKGIYVPDQGSIGRGRVRFLNLSTMPTELAGVVVDANQVNTIAGTGLVAPFDTGPATGAGFNQPTGVTQDANGNLWITDTLSSRLRFVNLASRNDISTEADIPPPPAISLITPGLRGIRIFPGTAAQQFVPLGAIVTVNKDVGPGASDSVPVNQAGFDTPEGIVATAQGLYIADAKRGGSNQGQGARRTGLIRFVNTTGQPVDIYPQGGANKITVPPGNIVTIAGSTASPLPDVNPGDGANPLAARFIGPTDVAIHPDSGDIYVAEAGRRAIRRINASTGAVSTILTGGVNDAYTGLSFDSQKRLLVANAGTKTGTIANPILGNSQILREKAAGQCAATPGAGCLDVITVSGGLLKNPRDVVEGRDGALYVTNAGPSETNIAGTIKPDNRLLRIVLDGTTGTATVVAGMAGVEGYSGDGGPPAQALLNLAANDFVVSTVGTPVSVRSVVTIIVSLSGDLIFTDSKNNAIRRIR